MWSSNMSWDWELSSSVIIVLHYWVFLQELMVFTGPVTIEDKAIKVFQNVGQQTQWQSSIFQKKKSQLNRFESLKTCMSRECSWEHECRCSRKMDWNTGSKPWSCGPLHLHLLLHYGNLWCGHMKHWIKDTGESNSQCFQSLLPRL